MIQIRSKVMSAVLLFTACATAATGAAATAATAADVAGPPAAVTIVAGGPARSMGEPAAAQDSEVGAVAATSFASPGGARVNAWTRPSGAGGWRPAGSVLPSGFGTSYDASAAAAPGGPVLIVAGASPPGQSCIKGGSVAIASVRSNGELSPPRVISDQRGTGSFDDRPAVAAGPGGTVWAAWSQGPDADACQNVGTGDHLEVAVSHDGGQTFGPPETLASGGGNSAFGARLTPLPGGQAAISWTEQFGGGQESVLVSVLGQDGHPSPPSRVLTGTAPPLDLPGASFYDFPAGDAAALPGGSLVVAVPLQQSGRTVIGLAAGTPGGQWKQSEVSPPAGSDLLLPALADVSPGTVRLLCAVHTRSGDRLGYDRTDVHAAQGSAPATPAPETGLAPVTPAPNGPGFFEIGEELSMSQAPGGLLAPVVVAGSSGARLETLSWREPAAWSASASPSPGAPGAQGDPRASAPSSARAAGGKPDPATGPALWSAVALVLAGAAGLGAWRYRRRG